MLAPFVFPAVTHAFSSHDGIVFAALDTLRSLPGLAPVAIRPRVLSAYGALVTAGMLSLLYLYRGRSFIVYWIGAWLFATAAVALVSRTYADATLDRVLTGLAVLFTVGGSGLVLVAAETYPQYTLRWRTQRLNAIAISTLWFLVAPFVVPIGTVVISGSLLTAGMLGWSARFYLKLARDSRYAGALLIGTGLAFVAVLTLSSAVASVEVDLASWGGQLGTFTILSLLLVALGMHLLIFEDMTQELRLANRQLAGANEEIQRLAITDPLTGCHNRRFLDEIERREIERHRRYLAPLTIVFLDVNHFKRLNDTLGHDRGDAVLWMIGALLRAQVRHSDYAIRWGGDEFVLLLNCSEREALEKGRRLKEGFERERVAGGLPPYLGLSAGVAEVEFNATTLRDAIREADSRMYGDKLAAPRVKNARVQGSGVQGSGAGVRRVRQSAVRESVRRTADRKP
ncbi:MAG TPA: GGDEF domain-containing protein [Vicinamibacterales bacterium]